jgi:protein gp37
MWDDRLKLPLSWKEPKRIFVNSMSDLFHEKVPQSFIKKVFETMRAAHWHTFQVLTKRSERLAAVAHKFEWPENVWMGVSVENRRMMKRIDDLREVPAAVRFLSVEPLLEGLGRIDLDGIHWVIVGGESGPGARPMDKEWVTEIRDQCVKKRVPFFFKQWGGVFKKNAGRDLGGRTWDQMPKSPPIRERVLVTSR